MFWSNFVNMKFTLVRKWNTILLLLFLCWKIDKTKINILYISWLTHNQGYYTWLLQMYGDTEGIESEAHEIPIPSY